MADTPRHADTEEEVDTVRWSEGWTEREAVFCRSIDVHLTTVLESFANVCGLRLLPDTPALYRTFTVAVATHRTEELRWTAPREVMRAMARLTNRLITDVVVGCEKTKSHKFWISTAVGFVENEYCIISCEVFV